MKLINNLKNIKGLKPSSLGWIPIEWEVKKIGKLTNTIAGATPSTSKREFWGGKIKWMNSGELNLKKIYDVKGRITEEGLKSSSTRIIPRKCILIGLAGQGKTRGTVAMNMIELCTNQSIAAILPSENFNEDYLYYNLDFRYEELRQLSTGDGGRGGLNLKIINSINVLLPTISEQTTIVNLLNTWDKAISTLLSLIKQKELRKKWLMQQLLTGKRRVKGFEKGEWKSINLSDAFEFIKSYSISRDGLTKTNEENLVYCIHYGDIHAFYQTELLNFSNQPNIPQISDNNLSIDDKNYLKDGDIIMVDASEDYEGIGEVVEVVNLENKVAVGGLHTIVLRENSDVIVKIFRSLLFSSEVVRNSLRRMATGTSVFSVTKTTLKNLSLNIPNTTKEQTAIANILLSADNEIQLLKSKLEKLKEQKKGLMQILLTGKVRVKV